MIKALLFDFFDVIRTDAYKAWLNTNGIPHEGPYFEASHQQDIGATSLEQFLDRLSELAGRHVTFEEIDGAATIDSQVVSIISGLSKKYKLGLVSNASSKFIREILAENDLERYFDVIIISSEVGMVKPSPEIFHSALEKLHVSPAEAVFIDDNIRYVEAAEKLGIHAIQFDSARQLQAELAKLGIEASPQATLPKNLVVADPVTMQAKLAQFSKAGGDGLHVIFDFDRTLTVKKAGSYDEVTTWHILDEHLPPQGQLESMRLFKKYRAIELRGELTTESANEWWTSSLGLYVEHGVNLLAVEKDFLHKASIRPGTAELFAYCAEHGIPTIILSAGIRDVIEIWCRHYGIEPTLIISTKLMLDKAGKITGWDQDTLVHVLNKSEATHQELSNIRKQRPHTFLVGDSLDDAGMAAGQDSVVRVRVLDPRADEAAKEQEVAKTFQKFDALIESGTLDPLLEMIAATAD